MLWRVSNEWQREMREALKDFDLTHAQFVLLAATIWLEDQNVNVNQAALSRHAAMDKMMVSDVIRTMEKKELVKREASKEDARSFSIRATQQGLSLLPKAMKAVETRNEMFFSRSEFGEHKIAEVLRSLSTF